MKEHTGSVRKKASQKGESHKKTSRKEKGWGVKRTRVCSLKNPAKGKKWKKGYVNR